MKRLATLIVLGIVAVNFARSEPDDHRPPRTSHRHHRHHGPRPAEVVESAAVYRSIVGRPSATEERARQDALAKLRVEVADWLGDDVPAGWASLPREADRLVTETRITPDVKPYATVYRAALKVDFSDARRAEIAKKHRREVVKARKTKLGGGLVFALIGLSAVSGYLKADEATRGYYTRRLRLLALGATGVAGVAIYRALA